MWQTWRAFQLGRRQRRRTRCSATRRIGTNLGVSLASRDELVAAGAPCPRRTIRPTFPRTADPFEDQLRVDAIRPRTPATGAPGLTAASTIR